MLIKNGGSEHEGCVEHNSILSATLEHSRYMKNSSVVIAWLDIKDAFGSVPHEYYWFILRVIRVSHDFVNILGKCYTDTSSFYSCSPLLTSKIPIKQGVRQGCPISTILFLIALNPVLEAVKGCLISPFTINVSPVQILEYADDIALIAKNTDDLQTLVNKIIGMEFRPEKCAYIQSKNVNIPSVINIYDIKIKKLVSNEFYQYLGVPVGDRNDQTPYDIIRKMIIDAEKLANCELFGWQKLKAYKKFLHSRLVFPFKTREVKTSALSNPYGNNKCSFNSNTKLRLQLRKMMNLPNHSEIPYFYISNEMGGAACIDLLDDYHC